MKYLTALLLLFCLLGSSGCGSVFGGHITECQRSAPRHGEPKRQIRPAVLAADIVLGLTLYEIPLIVDLADGAIYKPCTLRPVPQDSAHIKKITDSLHKVDVAIRVKDSIRQNAPFPKALCFSTDALQDFFPQPNLNIEYAWSHNAIGLYTGLILRSANFAVNPFANGQYTDPGTVYNGWAFKLYYKLYDKKWPNHYWCIQAVYKPEWFNNELFFDETKPDEATVSYTMSEKASVYGIDILRGYELVSKTHFHLDFFFGVGLHYHVMNYNVTSLDAQGYLSSPAKGYADGGYYIYSGSNTLNVLIPTPVMGLKIGFELLKKPKDTKPSDIKN